MRLELSFAYRDQQTYLARQFGTAPLRVTRPFVLPDGRLLVQLIQVGPGIMGGDRYVIDIRLAANTKVVLINQSATKLHSMLCQDGATQTISITLGEGAELEYYPGVTIPYTDSDFQQTVTAELAETARFAMLETWAMGRLALGEQFAFCRLSNRIRVNESGRPRYQDGLELLGASAHHLGMTDGHYYLSAGVFVWNGLPETLTPVQAPIQQLKQSEGALIVQPFSHRAFLVRAIDNNGVALSQRLRQFVTAWRHREGLAAADFDRFGAWL
jgi:urease accessory protein